MPEFTAGFGLSRITPSTSVRLAGYAARTAKSQGVHDDLYARALVLHDGERALALVSVDVLAVDSAFVAQLRARISEAVGLTPEAVMIAATHTHGGPVTTVMFSPEELTVDAAYLESLQTSIVNAVTTAFHNRFQARIGVGSTCAAGIGGNRHRLEGATDAELGVLKITDLSGQPRAVCLNYACHPTVLGPGNLQITADFPGFAVNRVSERLRGDVFAMFLNGAAGNISVGRSPKATALGLTGPGRTFERAEKIGHELADAAIKTLPSIATVEACTVDFATRTIDLDLRSLPSPAEAEAAMRHAHQRLQNLRTNGSDSAEIQNAQLHALYASLTHFEACRRATGKLRERIEIQCFLVGDTFFLGMPVEPFVEIGLELKRTAEARLFVVELANGYLGYLPASGASEEDGYETVSARFAAGSDRVVISAALELMQDLLKRAEGIHS